MKLSCDFRQTWWEAGGARGTCCIRCVSFFRLHQSSACQGQGFSGGIMRPVFLLLSSICLWRQENYRHGAPYWQRGAKIYRILRSVYVHDIKLSSFTYKNISLPPPPRARAPQKLRLLIAAECLKCHNNQTLCPAVVAKQTLLLGTQLLRLMN